MIARFPSTSKNRKNKKRNSRHEALISSDQGNKRARTVTPENGGEIEENLSEELGELSNNNFESIVGESSARSKDQEDSDLERIPENLVQELSIHRENAAQLLQSYRDVLNKVTDEFLYLLRSKFEAQEEEDLVLISAFEESHWLRKGLTHACQTIHSKGIKK